MPYVYVGRKAPSAGHTLFQIVKRLPRQGVGRVVIQNSLQHYGEPTFMRIKKVDLGRKYNAETSVCVVVDSWFRGRSEGEKRVEEQANTFDYKLVDKEEEERLWHALEEYKLPVKRVLPNTMAVPPLLKLYLEQRKQMSVSRIPSLLNLEDSQHFRLAAEGEEHDVPLAEVDGLGTPVTPHLYEGIDLSSATNPPTPNAPRIPIVPQMKIYYEPVADL